MTAPWHDAPPCPHGCGNLATPARECPNYTRSAAPDELWCPCCGEMWKEPDIEVVAKAWWSLGAWQAHDSEK